MATSTSTRGITGLPSTAELVTEFVLNSPARVGFVADMKSLVLSGQRLSANRQAAVERIIEQRQADAYTKHVARMAEEAKFRQDAAPVARIPGPTLEQAVAAFDAATVRIPAGTYTIALDNGAAWTTVRVKANKNPRYADTLEVLTGSDNSTSFTTVGELTASGFKPWTPARCEKLFWIDVDAAQRTLARPEVKLALEVLFSDGTDLEAAGVAYAMKSSRCRLCNRKLTVPASLYAGMGPECRGKANPAKKELALAA